ncbi:MAG: potassium channel family protein [Acidimicrobiales bacterium]
MTVAEPLAGDPRQHRRALAGVALRVTAMTAVAFTVYGFMPVTDVGNAGVFVRLVACLLAFFLAIGWQVRSILGSAQPRLKAAEALGTAVVLLIVIFAYSYLTLSVSDAGSFTQPLGRADCVYFTITVLATVGFGDIAPVTSVARLVTSAQMVLDLVVIGLVVRVLFGAAQQEVARRVQSGDPAEAVEADG